VADEQWYEATTTAQNERKYRVLAASEEQARARLRIHFKDPALLREGVIAEHDDTTDTTPRKITAIKTLPQQAKTQESAASTAGARG
jgi:hypothetical protein